jgi:hypothetical protein
VIHQRSSHLEASSAIFSEDKPFELDPGSPEIDQESDADTRRLELVQKLRFILGVILPGDLYPIRV